MLQKPAEPLTTENSTRRELQNPGFVRHWNIPNFLKWSLGLVVGQQLGHELSENRKHGSLLGLTSDGTLAEFVLVKY